METGTVKLSGLTKRFGDLVAVKSLDLEIPAGGFFSLIGPSGCGKTTTLRMVAGLEHPDEGTIEVGGEDITRRPAYRRPVNTVFQSYALFPHLSVADNVAFGLVEEKRPRAEIRTRVAEMLELVQLTGREKLATGAALGRAAAARRAGAGAGQAPEGALAGRAAGRARPETAKGAAGAAEGGAAAGRDHVRVRDA